jgi:hypothetical protein
MALRENNIPRGSDIGGSMMPLGPHCLSYIHQNPFFYMKFHVFATSNLPNLFRLTNDPIKLQPMWLVICMNFPSKFPKFDGKPGEDVSMDIMTYHLWC